MTAPKPDAVAQAREKVNAAFVAALVSLNPRREGATQKHSQCVDALIAAVRAECAAKVEALEKTRPYEPHEEERVWGFNEGIEAAVAALEAQP